MTTTSSAAGIPAPRAPVVTCLTDPIVGRHLRTQTGTRRLGTRSLPVYVCAWCRKPM